MGYGINGITDIPKAWRHALSAIQLLRPEAIMAGGCLRDRDEGVPVKDIDIFVAGSTPDDTFRFMQKLSAEGFRCEMSQDKTYGADKRKGFGGVIDVDYPGIPPLQIIVGEWTHENLLADFDFGICQIMFDGRAITRTRQYNADRQQRVFRLTPAAVDRERFERSVERFARLKAKYPEWRFRLPATPGSLTLFADQFSAESLRAFMSGAGLKDFDMSSVRSVGGTITGRTVGPKGPNMWQMPRG